MWDWLGVCDDQGRGGGLSMVNFQVFFSEKALVCSFRGSTPEPRSAARRLAAPFGWFFLQAQGCHMCSLVMGDCRGNKLASPVRCLFCFVADLSSSKHTMLFTRRVGYLPSIIGSARL